ncbi:putative disease resistance protein RGA3 [Bienertia sinuspersici]
MPMRFFIGSPRSWELNNKFKFDNNNHRSRMLLALTKLKKQSFKKCHNFLALSDSNPLTFRFWMSNKVQHILKSFHDLYEDAKKLGIRPAELASADARGVGNKGQQLTNLLCDGNKHEELSTIAIVGTGGLGKTTLARQLYENEAIIEHFTERFWICISDNFTMKRVFCVMFEKLTGGECELSNTEDIIKEFSNL